MLAATDSKKVVNVSKEITSHPKNGPEWSGKYRIAQISAKHKKLTKRASSLPFRRFRPKGFTHSFPGHGFGRRDKTVE